MKLFNGRFFAISGVTLAVAGVLGLSLMAPTSSMGQGTDVTAVADVVAAPSDATPDVGEDVTVSLVVTDAAGNPVADASCAVSIASQPGTDASVGTPNVTTDANGQANATVNVGSTAGTVNVSVDCGGTVENVSLVAGTSGAPAAPPASLPGAGNGGSDNSPMGPAQLLVLALIAALGITLVGTGATLALQQRRSK